MDVKQLFKNWNSLLKCKLFSNLHFLPICQKLWEYGTVIQKPSVLYENWFDVLTTPQIHVYMVINVHTQPAFLIHKGLTWCNGNLSFSLLLCLRPMFCKNLSPSFKYMLSPSVNVAVSLNFNPELCLLT